MVMVFDRINLLQFSNDLLPGNFGLFYLCFYGVLFTISYLQLWLTMKYVRSFDQPIIKFEKFSAENILDPIVNAMFRISSGDLQGPGTTKLLVSQKVNDYLLVFEKLVNLFEKQKNRNSHEAEHSVEGQNAPDPAERDPEERQARAVHKRGDQLPARCVSYKMYR